MTFDPQQLDDLIRTRRSVFAQEIEAVASAVQNLALLVHAYGLGGF